MRAWIAALVVFAGAPKEGGVTRPYVDDGDPRHQLDVYRPTDAGPHPVFVFFHGGVWQVGDRAHVANVGRALAARGIVTVVAGYRLTPDVVHPAHVEDAAAAVAWTMTHASDFDGDPRRVVVGGHSAGAHLATLLLFEPRWLAKHGVASSSLHGVVALSGVFDLAAGLDDTASGGRERFITPVFGTNPKALREASPIAHIAPTNVPIAIVLAGDDYAAMQRQSRRFDEALTAAGVAHTFDVVKGHDHFALVSSIGAPGDPVADLLASAITARRSSPSGATSPR